MKDLALKHAEVASKPCVDIVSELRHLLENRSPEIEEWFREQYGDTTPLFYSSVDLRYSGCKLVPVDNNLFPAGFNLLSTNARTRASGQIRSHIKMRYPGAKRLLIVPENHTRNAFYLENVHVLKTLVEQAGLDVRLGGLQAEETLVLPTAGGNELTVEPLERTGDSVRINGWRPDLVLVNNDLSSGSPDALAGITQPVFPPIGMGWYQRRKTEHFESYRQVAQGFGAKFDIDPWRISALFAKCGKINFREKQGLECLAANVEKLLSRIQAKYDAYGYGERPYVFIKANTGTYGMGIMTVNSPAEVFEINKNTRKKMSTIKEGVENTEVIIQEGIPTIDTVEGHPAEPMVYLVNAVPVGCMYRINRERDSRGNLNASGMEFQSDDSLCQEKALCPVQGLMGRLSTLAASRECYEPSWVI